jgi:rod shape-determining protein MreC
MNKSWLKNKRIMTSAAIFGLLIFFHWTGLLSPIESVLSYFISPVAVKFHALGSGINQVYNKATGGQDLESQLKQKEADNANLLKDNARLHEIEAENKTLRDYLKFYTSSNFKYQLADVVSREVVGQAVKERNKLIINKGFNDGLRENLVVVNSLGLVVGRITSVKENLAEVSLLVDQNCRLAVAVQNEEIVSGIASGESGLTIKVGFIPQTKNISVGQLVVTAGLENDVPGGLVVGKISQVDKASNELWQEAVVEASADLDNLKIVSVIIPPANNWQ